MIPLAMVNMDPLLLTLQRSRTLATQSRMPRMPLCGCRSGLPAGRRLFAVSGHDQNAGLVVDVGADSVEGGAAGPVVVAAQ